MGYASITGHVDVVPEHTFRYLTSSEHLPEWLVLVGEVEPHADHLDHVGAKVECLLRIAGRQLPSTWEVTRVHPPRSLRLTGSAQDGVGTIWITTTPWDGGTEVTFEVDYELPGGMFSHAADRLFLERAVARELKHSLANLRAVLEEPRHRGP